MKNSNRRSKSEDDRTLPWMWFLGSIFIVFGFGILLLTDATHIWRCRAALARPDTQLVRATLLKEKKNRRGNMLWDLKFHPPGQEPTVGRREAFERVFGHHEPGDTVPIAYPPSTPECWDLSVSNTQPKPYLANENFTISVNGIFGLFFTLTGLILALWSGRRLFISAGA